MNEQSLPVSSDVPDLNKISQPYFCEAHDRAACEECTQTALTHNVICVKINCFAPSQTRCESFGPFTQVDADSIAYQLGRLIPAEWSFYSQSAENVNDAVIIKQLLFEEE